MKTERPVVRLDPVPVLKKYEDILDSNPLLRLVIPLMLGIGVGEIFYTALMGKAAIFFLLSAIAIFCCIFIYRMRGDLMKRYFPFYIALSVSMMLLGIGFVVSESDQLQVDWPEEKLNLRVMLTQRPKEGEKVWNATAVIKGGIYDGRKIRLGLMKDRKVLSEDSAAVMVRQTDLQAGDMLLLCAQVSSPKNSGNPSEFDFAGWLRNQGMSGTAFCFSSQWKKSSIQQESWPIVVQASRWRDHLLQQYEKYFEGRELAVLSAMTLGDKTRLDAATRDIFSQTGVSHILALSGLHLSVLFMVFNKLVIIRLHRRWAYLLAGFLGIVGLWIFALLAGLPLSLIRASVMFSVMQLMVSFRHDSLSLNNLGLAALVLLLMSPHSLFDVGFQLSFISVLSILLIAVNMPCPKWMSYSWFTQKLFGVISVSCCAQLGTAPLVAYYFHTFPVYNLIANCVAIPLTYGILVVGILFFAIPFIQSFLAVLLGIFLAIMDMSLTELSKLPGAVLELYPSWAGVVLTYCFIIFFIGYWMCRKTLRLYLSILSLALLGVVEFYVHRPDRLQPQLIFYNLRKVPVLHAIVSSDSSYLWSIRFDRADSALHSVKRTFWKAENIASPVILDSALRDRNIFYDKGLIGFCGCRVALCTDDSGTMYKGEPMPVDYLLLARGVHANLKDILKCYRPKVIVLDGSLTDFYYKKYSQEADSASCEKYDIRKQGALIVDF